ncbi:MAG: hypothetical protein HYR96_11415 [Deltaproteobacteria bacterium]|nr:hypothetical protein [Deltaproteobacteria bacterium]MBI3293262.1 hypothetical protein [Deltaproteobacteria bacterium]
MQMFLKEPVYCFTSDIEWAPEWAIREMLSFFRDRSIPLTPFSTHHSMALKEFFPGKENERRVGLHPNFLMPSSHGKNPTEVIETVCALWPKAQGFRSHCFYEDSRTLRDLASRGFLYDSNLALHLQPLCTPLFHHTGIIRFPVFWEDDVHFTREAELDFHRLQRHFDSPGLKVINIHPLIFCLNAPTLDYYTQRKFLNQEHGELWRKEVYPGRGIRTFVEEMLKNTRTKNYRSEYLHDLYEEVSNSLTTSQILP